MRPLDNISLHKFTLLRSIYCVFRKHGFVTLVYVQSNVPCTERAVATHAFSGQGTQYDLPGVSREVESPTTQIGVSWYFQFPSQ